MALLLLTFPGIATLGHVLLISDRMLTYHNWSLPLTFLQSLGIHLGIFICLLATHRLENLRPLTGE
jgi:hypothetical protein